MNIVFKVFVVIDVITSAIAAYSGRYEAAIYYVLLGLLFTITYALTESEDIDDD